MFDFLKFLLKKPIDIIVFIFSMLFLLISFIRLSFNEKLIFGFNEKPNAFIFTIALVLLICFLTRYLFLNRFININERRQYSYIVNIDVGHTINIKQGDISEFIGGINKAILLPANTSFDEKCITDKNSALGSYFSKNFSEDIEKVKKLIIDTAVEKFSLSENKKYADFGDTILLPKYEGKNNILISAVTQDLPNVGIQANALGIISAVKNALSICSENRYSSITMPIIGTGHGGIKHSISLALICLQYFISFLYSRNHHVKELTILVFDPNKRLERDIFETVECIKKLVLLKAEGVKG